MTAAPQRRPGYLRPANAAFKVLNRLGLHVGPIQILTVPGRRSGQPRSTPVSPVHLDGHRYLLAPMQDAAWARNARAAGHGQLTAGRRTEAVDLREVHDVAVRRQVLTAFPSQVPHGVRLFKALGLVTSSDPREFAAVAPKVAAFEIGSSDRPEPEGRPH